MVSETLTSPASISLLTYYVEGFGLDVGSDGSYPFTYAEGLDFATNLAIDTIDFGTFHLYPSTCMYYGYRIHLYHTLM